MPHHLDESRYGCYCAATLGTVIVAALSYNCDFKGVEFVMLCIILFVMYCLTYATLHTINAKIRARDAVEVCLEELSIPSVDPEADSAPLRTGAVSED